MANIIFQLCTETKEGDFIIHDEYPTFELAVARGIELKFRTKQVVQIFELDTEKDFDEEILNIYKL